MPRWSRAVVDALRVGLDGTPPDRRRHEEVLLRAPVVAIPEDVQPRHLIEAGNQCDLVVGDGPQQVGDQARILDVGDERRFHAEQQVGPLEKPHLHKPFDQELPAVDGGGLGRHHAPIEGRDVGQRQLLPPTCQVADGVAAGQREGAPLGAGLVRPLDAESVGTRAVWALDDGRIEPDHPLHPVGHPAGGVVSYDTQQVFPRIHCQSSVSMI